MKSKSPLIPVLVNKDKSNWYFYTNTDEFIFLNIPTLKLYSYDIEKVRISLMLKPSTTNNRLYAEAHELKKLYANQFILFTGDLNTELAPVLNQWLMMKTRENNLNLILKK